MVDRVFWALDLGLPTTIRAEVRDYDPKTQGDAYPKGEIITYEFPAKGKRGPVALHWYTGTEKIPRPPELAADADEFLTIAKFRALRKLWARVEQACGLRSEPAFVSAETALP